jgi:hypothetical protein
MRAGRLRMCWQARGIAQHALHARRSVRVRLSGGDRLAGKLGGHTAGFGTAAHAAVRALKPCCECRTHATRR